MLQFSAERYVILELIIAHAVLDFAPMALASSYFILLTEISSLCDFP